MNVVVLGCGPAGLIAAWAAEQAGADVKIFSKRNRSFIPGSQYLHGPIPGVSSPYPEGLVQYVRLGTAEGYARKVYGDDARETGWQNYYAVYKSWNVRLAYDKLWHYFYDVIEDAEIDNMIAEMLVASTSTDLVISTIPQPALCRNDEHEFNGVPFYIRTLDTPPMDEHHDIVIYNGMPGDPWYRWSILSGLCSVEWTQDPGGDRIKGTKCTTNTCDCLTHDKFMRAGRWAEWHHGVLLHDIYPKVHNHIAGVTV